MCIRLHVSRKKGRKEEEERVGEREERGGGSREEFVLLGGVSASPWSQVDKLRQEEGKARGPPKLKSYLCYLQVVSNEDISLPL